MNSQPVSVKALHRVVSITAKAVIVPLCPKFFAITKQLPVVALPSMTSIAMSFSPRKPSFIAAGRNIQQKSTSLIKAIPDVSGSFPFASLNLNEAPRAMSDRGVAIFPR